MSGKQRNRSAIRLVNLDRSVERLSRFQVNNRHVWDRVTRFAAIDGAAVNAAALIDEGLISKGVEYNSGALGCAISHIRLWQEVAAQEEMVIIAEDDSVFSFSFREQEKLILGSVPVDWDIIVWGWPYQCFLWVRMLTGMCSAEIRFSARSSDVTVFQALEGRCLQLVLGNFWISVFRSQTI